MSLQVELATEGSSSTTTTSVDLLAFALGATVVINLEALSDKVLLSFGTGERVGGLPLAAGRWRLLVGALELTIRLTLNWHSNHNASSAAPRAADV